ncbi:MAG: ABC transporter ATP-binding protein [Mogibacterium sp.]|nr:ABC transporter ATP-binding protein [Mogibacterium sp.]
MIRNLLQYFKPHKKLFILDMCCALFAAAVDLAFPMVSRYAMYELIPNGLYRALFAVMTIVVLAYLLRSLAQYVMTYWGHTFGVRVEADIRADLFRHLQELDFELYDHNRTGTLMNRLTGDLFEITELSHHGPEDIVIAGLTILGSLFFMFRMQPKLAALVTVLIPVFAVIVIVMRRRMSRASLNVKRKMADINAQAESSISGVRTSKAFANEDVDRDRFDASNERFKTAKSDYYKAMGMFLSSQEFFMCILPVAVIAYGSKLIMDGEMNYIDLITFTLFVSSFINPIRKLANFSEIFTNGMAGLRRFKEIMDTKPNVQDRPDAKPLQVTAGAIDVDDVSFSYEERSEVLHDVTLHIRPGETLAVVGHSGGGKTTLCQLIPRFYNVDSGSIRIDGQDVRDVTGRSIAENVGIVQQDVFIFADTIYNNIAYGRPGATYEEVIDAAKRARIYEDILAMPDGFDTYVGERGTMLSGGQKQRLSIARIFLKNPKILILDEATSALDTITEQAIQSSFDELAQGRTSLIIAHRLATIRNADRIVLIDGGRIREEGTHEELMQLGGEYARLYNTQKLAG